MVRKRIEVDKFLRRFSSWKVENAVRYEFRRGELLEPIQDGEVAWRLVLLANYRAGSCQTSKGKLLPVTLISIKYMLK